MKAVKNSNPVETVIWKNKIIAYIIHAFHAPKKTAFITKENSNLQVGFVVYKGKTDIPRHIHKPVIRHLDHTEEVLVVRKGSAILELYSDDKVLLSTHEVGQGDVIIFISGGHGFKVKKNMVLLEIKQGPYTGINEKERF